MADARPVYVKMVNGKIEGRFEESDEWNPLWCAYDLERTMLALLKETPTQVLKVEAVQQPQGHWKYVVHRTETQDGTKSNSNL
jgi:hypothetical protein